MDELACNKSIVDGTQHPVAPWYGPHNVLIDSCDDSSNVPTEASVDWWAASDRATEDDAFFEVDLGCQKCVSMVTVRNSANGSVRHR